MKNIYIASNSVEAAVDERTESREPEHDQIL